MDIREQILSAFQVEHREQVEGIRSILASLEGDPSGSSDARWDEAFRMAHTLKGGARVCDLRDLESLGHRMESLFACVREGKLAYTKQLGVTLMRALDAIEDWMAEFTAGRKPATPTEALAAIERLVEEAKQRTAPQPASPPPIEAEAVETPPKPVETPEATATPQASQPPQADDLDAPPESTTSVVREIETLRVETRHLDGVLRSADGLFAVNTDCEHVLRELGQLSAQVRAAEHQCAEIRKNEASVLRKMDGSPELATIARHVESMAQQMRRIARQERVIRDAHRRASWALRVVSESLRENVQKTRMVAAVGVWQGLRQLVRNLAQDEGKEVEFVAEGLDVRADRMVLQQLKDPLIHALRNALVHGIESPDEREARGKPRIGQMRLAVRTTGNRLHVVVEDDGRGIDLARVAKRAEQRGLVTDAALDAENAEEQLTRLLFLPAFSTNATVNELAGRGMGLSVVQETVKRLRGNVQIRSRSGPGARLEMSVPLYVSAERVVLVSCAGQALAIPIHAVEQLLHLATSEIQNIDGRRMVLVDGTPLTLIDLAQAIGCEARTGAAKADTLSAVVLRCGTQRIGAVVESFLAERETLIKDLDEHASTVGHFVGAVLLESNDVALVLDVSRLELNSMSITDEAETAEPQRATRTPTILVVDDSFTTRTLERSILETNGFDVRVAVDGVEALNVLRTEPIDLVIADVEMPKMDGLTLLREMRDDARYRSLPVILVTSLDRAEDRRRGLEHGANAYIVKRKFDHQGLLDTIQRFL